MFVTLQKWISTPSFIEDDEKSRSAALLNMVIWIFISAAGAYALFAPIEPEFVLRRWMIIGPFLVILLFMKQLLNWGYVRSAGLSIVGMLWLMLTTAMFFGADYNNPAYMGYVIVVVTAGLILNWRAAIGWSLVSILTNAIIVVLGQKGYLNLSQEVTPAFAFWSAQTAYIMVTTILLSQATRKIDEAFEKTRHEIRERKKAEAEREKFIKELEAKNAELERFTYTVSHDLKSPLITIGGYLGFLEKDMRDRNEAKFDNDVLRIREAAGKMQELLNDLLELSRIGRLMNPPEEVEFKEIVKEALALVDGRMQEKGVHVVGQENLPAVYGDKIRLIEVMQNLLDNAAKFTDKQRQPMIEVGALRQDNEDVFFVKDNGIGIDPSHHERIFGLFNKLSADNEGTGIGLALVKRTIEVHGGRIWVESKPGEGSTFFFTVGKKPDEI
jgi:signal transduction histidine kinase